VPRSVFLGRVVQPGEPLWLPDDRTWALALAEVEAGECSDCRHPVDESMDAENEFAYEAHWGVCHACRAAATAVRAHADAGGDTTGVRAHAARRE